MNLKPLELFGKYTQGTSLKVLSTHVNQRVAPGFYDPTCGELCSHTLSPRIKSCKTHTVLVCTRRHRSAFHRSRVPSTHKHNDGRNSKATRRRIPFQSDKPHKMGQWWHSYPSESESRRPRLGRVGPQVTHWKAQGRLE